MITLARTGRYGGTALLLTALSWLPSQPAGAFCVRNDTGAAIRVEADGETAVFSAEIDNNKKACCSPKDEACAIGKADIELSIGATEGDARCSVSVNPKGNVNVTGKQNALKCKANKAGSTKDWASG
ncbi:MAG: hypothetical protein AAGA21_21635 [Pseudomonadota bacterium]